MITSVKTTVTINSSQVVHWGSEFGTMCGAGAGFGKEIKDSQAATATCKRCVKLMALQVELAHDQAIRDDEAHTIYRAKNDVESNSVIEVSMELAHELALEQDFEALLAKGTEVVSTDELAEGDVVLHYGMVIKLGAPQVFQGFSQRAVYHLPGQVQNMAEIFRPGHVTWGLLKADGSWPIQGNSMARWTRVSARPTAAEAWDAAHDENAERAMATARDLDIWLGEGVVLVSPMLDSGLFVFERWGKKGAELREMRTGILHTVSQSYVTTWKYVPRPIELNQVWRSKGTGDLVRIVDTSRDDVRLIGLDAEDVPFWLSRSMLAEHFVWAPQKAA